MGVTKGVDLTRCCWRRLMAVRAIGGLCSLMGRGSGRDVHCWTPRTIRTSPIRASGSYLGGVTAKRRSGACRMRSRAWGRACPALSPERVLLVRVPLGPRPWLHRLRRRDPGFVHRRLRLLTFPPRTIWPRGPMADQEISRFPHKELADMPESSTTPGHPDARAGAV